MILRFCPHFIRLFISISLRFACQLLFVDKIAEAGGLLLPFRSSFRHYCPALSIFFDIFDIPLLRRCRSSAALFLVFTDVLPLTTFCAMPSAIPPASVVDVFIFFDPFSRISHFQSFISSFIFFHSFFDSFAFLSSFLSSVDY